MYKAQYMSAAVIEKVVIVTGASSGIGRATAIKFAKLGYCLVIHGRNVEKLNKTISLCEETGITRDKIHLVIGDVQETSCIESIVDGAISTFGRIDVLVNNVGANKMETLQSMTMESFDDTINTNLRSVIMLSKLCMAHLIKTKGNIVNVSSILGMGGCEVFLSYNISKAGLDQFTRCSALEFAPQNVRINSVNPGIVRTHAFENMGMSSEDENKYLESAARMYPIRRVGEPNDIADLIAFLASEKASFITGAIVPIDGGIMAGIRQV